MPVLALRVDGKAHWDLQSFLEDDGGAYLLVCEEPEGNPHMHAVLHSTRNAQAVRMALRRALPYLSGNGSYSVAEVRDLAKYERYMCKGEAHGCMPEITGAYGIQYSDAEWQAATHEEYWAVNQELQEQRKKMNVAEATLAACKDARIAWSNRERIAEMYIRELVAREKSINLFSVKSAVNLIQVQLCPDDQAIKDLAAHCANY